MKTKPKSILSLLCLLAFTSFFTGCGETVISEDQMQERDGLVYTVNQESPFTGVVESHYRNGQISKRSRFKDGKKDGTQTIWYTSGKIYQRVSYKDGFADGKWTAWYENGQKMEEWNYDVGFKDGKWTEWSANGEKTVEGIYKSGKKEGTWKEKNAEGTYRNDLRVGRWAESNTYWKGVWEGSYKQGKRDGLWTLRSTYQRRAEEINEFYGNWCNWFENDQKKIERTYKQGELITEIFHFPNNEIAIRKDRLILSEDLAYAPNSELPFTGTVVVFQQNYARLQEKWSYNNGKADGTYTDWYDCCSFGKHWEGRYKDGAKDGLWVRYDNSETYAEHLYRDGRLEGARVLPRGERLYHPDAGWGEDDLP